MNNIKQIPYGVADFVSVMERNLYYVDKTMFLEDMEKQPDNLFFIRPRRFGKSLFISMMRAYYDKAMTDQFDSLFGSLYIGQHPTPLRGRYQVLYLDFSQIGGSISQLDGRFDEYCSIQLNQFVRKYNDDYPSYFADEFFALNNSASKLNMLTSQAKELNIPLYLIIDEYDNFTNIVLNEDGEEVYHAITHASGFYREVFKKFKGMFERIFMTGVSPVTLDDLTSGFNIGWNISTEPMFDKMLGFSTTDVRDMFTYYKTAGLLPKDCDVESMILEMRPWYDNYCFAKDCLKSDIRVFNCDMVLYYLRNYMTYGHAPEQMIDPNTKTDYNKLKKLLQLDRLDGDRRGILQRIMEDGEIVAELHNTFSAQELIKAEMFPSLLFYYGMLTMIGTRGRKVILGIPNNNVRKQYYEYILENYQSLHRVDVSDLTDKFYDMSFDGKWSEALQYIADSYKNLSSVRDSIEGERSIQGFFMAYLSLNDYYITAPELELSHGFCDFFLLPNLTHYQSEHSYILELKYLPKKDYAAKAEAQWAEAVAQIDRYAEAPRVEAMRQGTKLHKIIMQFSSWELMRMEEVE